MDPDELEAEKIRLIEEKRNKAPVLKRVAFNLPPLVEVLRFFNNLCVGGDKVEAFLMTAEVSPSGGWSLN
jgi:hypothetical protein